MNRIDLKEHVRRAIESSWPAFAESHPRLAAVLDQVLLVEQATQCLADDPDFQATMHHAAAVGLVTEALTDQVPRRITAWLRQLL
jgi:hypothetical protein